MGGFMQPQGHVQVLLNMLEFGMHPQQAIDAARYQVENSSTAGPFGAVSFEEGITNETVSRLTEMGHVTSVPAVGVTARTKFGWGQVISRGAWWKLPSNTSVVDDRSVWWVGVDPRCDGSAVGY